MRTDATQLLNGESIVRESGVSRANLVFVLCVDVLIIGIAELAVVLIMSVMGALMSLAGPASASSWAQLSLTAVLVAPLAMLCAVAWMLMDALSARYTLTDRRLIVSRGVVSRAVSQAELYRVQDVHVHQNFVARLLNYGHVYVETAGTVGIIRLGFVDDPTGWSHSLYEARTPSPVTSLGLRHQPPRSATRAARRFQVRIRWPTSSDRRPRLSSVGAFC